MILLTALALLYAKPQDTPKPDPFQALVLKQLDAHKDSNYKAVYMATHNPDGEPHTMKVTFYRKSLKSGTLFSIDGKVKLEVHVEGQKMVAIMPDLKQYRSDESLPVDWSSQGVDHLKAWIYEKHSDEISLKFDGGQLPLWMIGDSASLLDESEVKYEGNQVKLFDFLCKSGGTDGEPETAVGCKVWFNTDKNLILRISNSEDLSKKNTFLVKLESYQELKPSDNISDLIDYDLKGYTKAGG